MNGAETLAMVRDTLTHFTKKHEGQFTLDWDDLREALAALDGCILLTRAEAEWLRASVGPGYLHRAEALALLGANDA